MSETRLRKVGGSVMLAVPPAILELLGLGAGARVGISVDQGRLIVEPAIKRRYAIADLIAQCDPSATPDADERDWLDGPPVGAELL
jgi:antitoxin ChpS